ncbi:hypothetical protein ABDH65_13415 [Heyndrickxia ginsengihumi]|uniref:hypothetical protein n=1 Tax=Heyndrickxia ginsengihumi TaxID=363870 RepID=UPI003D24F53E
MFFLFILFTVRGLSQFDAEKKARDFGYKLLDNCKGYHEIHMYYSLIFQGCCEICGDERKRNKLRFPYDKVVTLFSQLKYLYPNIKLLTTRTEYENYKGKSEKFNIRYTCVYCGKEKKGKLQDIKAHHLMHKHCSSEFMYTVCQ